MAQVCPLTLALSIGKPNSGMSGFKQIDLRGSTCQCAVLLILLDSKVIEQLYGFK